MSKGRHCSRSDATSFDSRSVHTMNGTMRALEAYASTESKYPDWVRPCAITPWRSLWRACIPGIPKNPRPNSRSLRLFSEWQWSGPALDFPSPWSCSRKPSYVDKSWVDALSRWILSISAKGLRDAFVAQKRQPSSWDLATPGWRYNTGYPLEFYIARQVPPPLGQISLLHPLSTLYPKKKIWTMLSRVRISWS